MSEMWRLPPSNLLVALLWLPLFANAQTMPPNAPAGAATLPEKLSILPLRGSVLFPGGVLPLNIGREKTIKLLQAALARHEDIGVVTQRDATVEDPTSADLSAVGTLARIVQFTQNGAGFSLVLQAGPRFAISSWIQESPWFEARVTSLASPPPSEQEQPEFAALSARSRSTSRALLALDPRAPPDAALLVEQISDPGVLVDLMVANADLSVADKQAVLATAPVLPRLRLAVPLLEHHRDALAKAKGGPSPVPAPAPTPATWQELITRTQQVSLGPKEAMAASMRQLGKQVLFDGAAAPKGPLELPRRFDSGVFNQATGRVEVVTVRSGSLVHEPMGFTWHDRLEVRLRDFAWDQCALYTNGDGPAVEGALREWFLRWFDVHEQKKPDARGFHGVVHSLEFVSPNHATVDLGTAPPSAFEDLLQALVKVGVTRVEFVGSRLPLPPALPPRAEAP